jgi:5'-nucleotidase
MVITSELLWKISGGDNFTVFASGANAVVGPLDLDAFVSYVKGLTQPCKAVIEGRVTRLN